MPSIEHSEAIASPAPRRGTRPVMMGGLRDLDESPVWDPRDAIARDNRRVVP